MRFKSFYYLCMRSKRMLSIMAGWQRLSEQVIIDKSLSGLQHLKFLILGEACYLGMLKYYGFQLTYTL